MSVESRQFKQNRWNEHKSFERTNANIAQTRFEDPIKNSSDNVKSHTSDTLKVVLSFKGIELTQMRNTSGSDAGSDSDEVFEEAAASQEQPAQRHRKRERQYSVTFHQDVRKTENEPVSRQNSSAPLIRKQKNSESDFPNHRENVNERVWCKRDSVWCMLIFLCISASVLSVSLTVYFVSVKDIENAANEKIENPPEVNPANYMPSQSRDNSSSPSVLLLIGGESSERIVASVNQFSKSLFPACVLPPLPQRLKWGNAGFVNNNLLVCGGVGPDSKLIRACWALDSTSRHWRSLDNLTR